MKNCPKCESNMIIDIIYGYPGSDLVEEQEKGKVELGGCIIEPESPTYKCKSCDHAFSNFEDEQ